jgi:hypothetical protein
MGASSTASARVNETIAPHTLAASAQDRAALANVRAGIFHRCEYGPITKLKSAPGLVKVRRYELIQLQRVDGGEGFPVIRYSGLP